MTYDPRFMDICFAKSREALTAGEVPIGCVFVRRGHVVHAARNVVNETRNPTLHAEIVAVKTLEKAGFKDFDDVAVYVNCEPCVMCASALQRVRVKAIFFGCSNPRFGGCGTVVNVFDVDPGTSKGQKPLIEKGFRETEAIDLLKEFYKGENPNAPPEKRKPARK